MATKWGIVSATKICQDFANALSALPADEHAVTACAGRVRARADAFAAKFNVPNVYETYEEMAAADTYDVAFVSSVLPNHLAVASVFINAGKNVLIQRPMGLNLAMTKEMVELARAKDVFLMEAVATRFLPVQQRVREIIAGEDLGNPKTLVATLGLRGCHLPGRRIAKKWHGGGTVLDHGQACIQLALMVFGGQKPQEINAVCAGTSKSGTDVGVSVTLQFSQKRTATFVTDRRMDLPCEAVLAGTNGSLTLARNWWCGNALTLATNDGKESGETFPWPKGHAQQFHSMNGEGLSYQAQEVRRCLLAGKKESDVMSLDESILIAEIAEEINKKIGAVEEEAKEVESDSSSDEEEQQEGKVGKSTFY